MEKSNTKNPFDELRRWLASASGKEVEDFLRNRRDGAELTTKETEQEHTYDSIAPSVVVSGDLEKKGTTNAAETTELARSDDARYDPQETFPTPFAVDFGNSNTVAIQMDGPPHGFVYDQLGRRSRETKAEGPIHHSYDQNGNLIEKTGGAETAVFEYDERNRLMHIRAGWGELTLAERGPKKGGERQSNQLLISELPANYAQLVARLTELDRQFHAEMAAALQPQLNEKLKSMPHESYAEKQEIASWVNGQLRHLGLAIRCPKTGKAAILVADVQGREGGPSRFRLEISDDQRRKVRTFSSRSMPTLDLMEDVPREEALAAWAERVRKNSKKDRDRE